MALIDKPVSIVHIRRELEQAKKWSWQNKRSGEDPLVAWKKMKADGTLDEVYEVRDIYSRVPLKSRVPKHRENRLFFDRTCRYKEAYALYVNS